MLADVEELGCLGRIAFIAQIGQLFPLVSVEDGSLRVVDLVAHVERDDPGDLVVGAVHHAHMQRVPGQGVHGGSIHHC